MAQGLPGAPAAADEVGQLGRFQGECGVDPALGPAEGEVLLDEDCPQGHRSHGGRRAEGMVGQAGHDPEALCHVRQGGQVHARHGCRVGARAVQDDQVLGPRPAGGLHRLGDLGLGRHPRGHDQGPSGRGASADKGQVHQFKGGDLVGGRAEVFEQVHGREVEGRGEQGHARLAGLFEQGRVPVPGRVGLGVELVEAAAVPKAPLDAESRPVMVEGDGVGGVGLDLDGVGTRLGRRRDQVQGAFDVAIVVARHLGHHIGRMAGPDGPAGDVGQCLAHQITPGVLHANRPTNMGRGTSRDQPVR